MSPFGERANRGGTLDPCRSPEELLPRGDRPPARGGPRALKSQRRQSLHALHSDQAPPPRQADFRGVCGARDSRREARASGPGHGDRVHPVDEVQLLATVGTNRNSVTPWPGHTGTVVGSAPPGGKMVGEVECVFCDWRRSSSPTRVYQDDTVFAEIDRRQPYAGHVLVMPTRHVETSSSSTTRWVLR